MAKQKSGLGRGLNALFDENPMTSAVTSEDSEAKTEKKKSAPASKADAASSSTASEAAASSAKEATAPTDQKQESALPSGVKVSQNIYFSEDALENAKVVEREARKPTKRSAQNGPGATSKMFKQEQAARAASTRSADTAASKQPSAKPAPAEPKKQETGDAGLVPIDKIKPNPDQPRTNFKQEEIEELAASIKKEGLLQPILVRRDGDHYQIIAGERRWQACKNAGMKEIPVRYWKADNDKALELALIENIQRTDLNPIEEAYGYKRLMERKGMTQSEVAQTVSKGRSTIANALRLLDLPEDAQQLLFEDKITAGHARAILSIPDVEGRKTLTKKLLEDKLSVRETEAIARLLSGRAKASEGGAAKRIPAPASFKKAARGLTRFLSVPVRVKTVQGKNKIEIQFKDEEELQRIVNLISEAKNPASDTD